MSFSTELAKLVTDQVSRFVTLNGHQLAGHVANLDFWLAQIKNAIAAIDGYGQRFKRLKTGQNQHISEHHTIEFDFIDRCCTKGPPGPPQKVPFAVLKAARHELCDAARRFLVRCCNEGCLDESVVYRECAAFGVGVDAGELKRRRI